MMIMPLNLNSSTLRYRVLVTDNEIETALCLLGKGQLNH